MYKNVLKQLEDAPKRWLITGAAGFIGSNLTETLLAHGQDVVAYDNLSTGHKKNIELAKAGAKARAEASSTRLGTLTFLQEDICDRDAINRAMKGIDVVSNQAALGSVPRSLATPLLTHHSNVNGFLEVLDAARNEGIERFVYASSSSVYGDAPELPKVEDKVGRVLSPYACTKSINEQYAGVFEDAYGIRCVGLRYFNVFGKRQDPEGAYAAVIPRWVAEILSGKSSAIFGDGETSRDFCFVDNAVQANILAGVSKESATNRAYNVAFGQRTTLNELFAAIVEGLAKKRPELSGKKPEYQDFRKGDVRHSLADISAAQELLGYAPSHNIAQGLEEALEWYVENL